MTTMKVHDHVGEALSEPMLIRLGANGYALRYEAMKVASARVALAARIASGQVRPGGTVIDSSSGIYAYALALACHERQVRCRIIGSTTIDATLRTQLLALGVELEQMPSSTSLRLDQNRRVQRIEEILASEPDTYWMRQYHDPVHYEGYLPVVHQVAEQLRAEGVKVVRVVAAVGSGVSSGAMRLGFEQAGFEVELVGIQPFGSVTFGGERVDDPDMLIAGIGSSIEFRNVRHELYDVIHWVSYEVARAGALGLLGRHALFAGMSSGACFAASLWEEQAAAKRRSGPATRRSGPDAGRGAATVMVLPDTGHRYTAALGEALEVVAGSALEQSEGVACAVCGDQVCSAVDCYEPCLIETIDEVALPWSRMAWNRRGGT